MVSIITPVHNRPQYLEESILSIQNQTYTDWEHIIIDDGSTNSKTQEILTKISNYPNIKIYHTENKGLGAARNFGIEKAQGKFILTLDDDDLWRTDFIEKALNVLEKDANIGATTSWMQEFGDRKQVLKPLGGYVENFLVNNNSVHGMFRKEDWLNIGKYDESKFFQPYTDWDFWLRLTAKGKKIEVLPEVYFYYRTHKKGSMLKDAEKNHTDLFKFLITKNKDIYQEYVVDALFILEQKLIVSNKNASTKNLIKRLFYKCNPFKHD